MAHAIGLGDEVYDALRESYARRRTFMANLLTRVGFDVHALPGGTYYLAAGIRAFADDDYAFCRAIPAELGVAAIPFSAFYSGRSAGRDVIRVAYCKGADTLEEAGRRLEKLKRR